MAAAMNGNISPGGDGAFVLDAVATFMTRKWVVWVEELPGLRLTARYRWMIRKRTKAAIAARLGCSISAVKVRIHVGAPKIRRGLTRVPPAR